MINYKLSGGARILFVGINPHFGSYRRGVPFSNNKMFWYLLSRAGLIDEKMETLRDDKELRRFYDERFMQKYNLNIINIVDTPTRQAVNLDEEEIRKGVRRLNEVIIKYHPKVVCFVGKVTFRTYTGEKRVHYGWQKNIMSSKVFVMHFPVRGSAKTRINELKQIQRFTA